MRSERRAPTPAWEERFRSCFVRPTPEARKDRAKARVEEFLGDGLLAEKVSQGRHHVYFTKKGRETARALLETEEGR